MADKFQDQGGAATMNPSWLLRFGTSRVMSRLSQRSHLEKQREKTELARIKAGEPHLVEYFHQVEDGYSHLAAQVLGALASRYDVKLVCHLVRGPSGKNSPEPELLLQLSRYDSHLVAPEYGLEFPSHPDTPDPGLVSLAGRILAAQDNESFIREAAAVGQALWAGDQTALDALAQRLGVATEQELEQALDKGVQRRTELKHYSGAMLYYGGEWYWGVDRLYHLEKRLAELGADKRAGEAMLVPRPPVDHGPLKDDGRITLEIYPSLRSPYTSISFDRAWELARETGVNFIVKPVLPMVMRGVPATRQKGVYIFTDTAREAYEAGVPYGRFYDPIGEPARRGYSIYPWACEQGKGNEFLSAFLSCAFAQGVNTGTDRGLRKAVEQAGLNWAEARQHIGETSWEDALEKNRLDMYESGLWGVPSLRLLDETGGVRLALWGQDRLWLFAREIQRLLAARGGAPG